MSSRILLISVVEIAPRRGAEMVGGKSSSALFPTVEARSTDAPFKSLLWWVPLSPILFRLNIQSSPSDGLLPRGYRQGFSCWERCDSTHLRVSLFSLVTEVVVDVDGRYATSVVVTETGEVSQGICPIQVSRNITRRSSTVTAGSSTPSVPSLNPTVGCFSLFDVLCTQFGSLYTPRCRYQTHGNIHL